MVRHEREDFGPETRDVIEGLRRLALEAEPPPDLLARVEQRGARCLPDQERGWGGWRRVMPQWPWRPVVWGPAVAVVCFIAGVFVPPPDFLPLGQQVPSEISTFAPKPQQEALDPGGRAALTEPPAAVEQSRLDQEAPPQSVETRQLTARFFSRRESAHSAVEHVGTMTTHLASPSSQVAYVQISLRLPLALHDQLLREAQRRQENLSTILHEAVVTYVHTGERE